MNRALNESLPIGVEDLRASLDVLRSRLAGLGPLDARLVERLLGEAEASLADGKVAEAHRLATRGETYVNRALPLAQQAPSTSEGRHNVTAAEQVSKRFSRRLRHRLIAGGPTSAGDDIPGWPALLASAEVLRERRVADRRSAALLTKAKARIPADAGSYHPDKVTHQLFEAMERLGAGYLARQLERLDCLAVMVSYLDHVVPLERPKPPSRRGKKKRSRST